MAADSDHRRQHKDNQHRPDVRIRPNALVSLANSRPGIVAFNLATYAIPFLPVGRVKAGRRGRIFGWALLGAGWLLGLASLRRLGPGYSRPVTIKPDQQLISDGPYSVIRHPIYVANMMMYLGLSLALGSIPGLAGLGLIVFPRFLAVAKYEERLMADEFGQDYESWKGRTGGFLPRWPRVPMS